MLFLGNLATKVWWLSSRDKKGAMRYVVTGWFLITMVALGISAAETLGWYAYALAVVGLLLYIVRVAMAATPKP